jgi:hypothetical protein
MTFSAWLCCFYKNCGCGVCDLLSMTLAQKDFSLHPTMCVYTVAKTKVQNNFCCFGEEAKGMIIINKTSNVGVKPDSTAFLELWYN